MSEKHKPFLILALLTAILTISACGTDPDTTDGDADADSDGDSDGDFDSDVENDSDTTTDGDPDGDEEVESGCTAPERVAYTTTDYTTGSAGLLTLADWSSQPNLITLHSDILMTCDCGTAVVIERLGGDNLTLLSPDGLSLIDQYSLGARSNPYDAWFDGDVAYVSLFGEGKVVAVDLNDGHIINEVDLTSLADDDGNPEAAMMYEYGGVLYVAIQLLDQNSTLWDPTGPGLLATISLDPFELTGSIQLDGANPSTDIIAGEEEGIVYVGHAGSWSVEDDGGIERVDLNDGETDGMIMGPKQLGGNVIDFVIVDAELGYAAINIPSDRDILISFNPSDGGAPTEIASSDSYTLVDVLLDEAGHLIVADRAALAPGLRVFNVGTGQELHDDPINTGIPPSSMCLLPEPEQD